MKTSILTATVLLAALAGCSGAESEADREAEYRKANVNECLAAAKAGLPEDVAQKACDCAIDKVIEKYGLVDNVNDAQIQEVLGECAPVVEAGSAG